MDWVQWLYDQLNDPSVTDLAPGGLHAAGSLTGAPNLKPFVVIRMDLTTQELNDNDAPQIVNQNTTILVHDDPGSYDNINTILGVVLGRLVGQVAQASAIACVWQGTSQELADEFYGTIMRSSSYRLVGGV